MEKAVGYEQRRLIRGQIRIAKKMLEKEGKKLSKKEVNSEFLGRVRSEEVRQSSSRERSFSPKKSVVEPTRESSPLKTSKKGRLVLHLFFCINAQIYFLESFKF